MDVEANAGDSAYQLWQGMLAFGVGGVNGVGLGMGRQQMHFLPEAHTDFIFPVIGEELGLISTLSILISFTLLFLFVYWKLRLSTNCTNINWPWEVFFLSAYRQSLIWVL